MTARDLLRILGRRWYLVLVGMLLTALAVHGAANRPGVYWARFDLVLLAPVEDYHLNKIEDPPYQLAPLAAVLVTDWNGSQTPLLTASPDTTLFSLGVRDGVQVRLPNQGSQFRPLFTAATVDVQVVGSSPEEVANRTSATRERLTRTLQRRQDMFGVSTRERVTAITSPTAPDVQYVSASRTRASASTAAVGIALTVFSVWVMDRALRGWRRRRLSATPGGPETSGP
ncbi:hypothetical protein [uncultured Friedmanniella sp.]|uniref:hypothetical protein n=1 Tax=uncultured Friedmanniella sp. TaxID=335381 RepID=UPI0035C9C55B